MHDLILLLLFLWLIAIPLYALGHYHGARARKTSQAAIQVAGPSYTLHITDTFLSGNHHWLAITSTGQCLCSGYCHKNRWPQAAHSAVQDQLLGKLPEPFEAYFASHHGN